MISLQYWGLLGWYELLYVEGLMKEWNFFLISTKKQPSRGFDKFGWVLLIWLQIMRLISRLEYFQTLILSILYHRLSDTLSKQKGKVGSSCMDWTEIYIIIGMFFISFAWNTTWLDWDIEIEKSRIMKCTLRWEVPWQMGHN